MRTATIIDDGLSLPMGTTGILFGIHETVRIDYQIDALDDTRRDAYINTINQDIERLEKFSKEFKNETFSNWVKRHINFLRADIKRQLYYEDLSDRLRDKLFEEVKEQKEKIRNENLRFESLFFEKSFKSLSDSK